MIRFSVPDDRKAHSYNIETVDQADYLADKSRVRHVLLAVDPFWPAAFVARCFMKCQAYSHVAFNYMGTSLHRPCREIPLRFTAAATTDVGNPTALLSRPSVFTRPGHRKIRAQRLTICSRNHENRQRVVVLEGH